ncbi:DUF6087 family protein [Kitasatospora paranensis]|uniref:DUF6087 family protein n=1 Tax=Kitasatospora paranensis TaxID=258053 RepID=A0ABW2FTM4_9ACTN
MFGSDEPAFDRYTDRAEVRRPAGTRDAVLLGEGSDDGYARFADGPRLVVEWDGRVWQPVAVADTYAAAYQMVTQGGLRIFPQA